VAAAETRRFHSGQTPWRRRGNLAYAEWFGEHRPVRTCIVAANLTARERVKLDAVAYRERS
jgi:hypothetical protein